MKRDPTSSMLALAVFSLLAIPLGAQQPPVEFSDQAETARLRRLADGLHLPISGDAEFRSEANFIGFRSKEILVSRRTDSRTYFVQDLVVRGRGNEAEPYQGSDREFLERFRQAFELLEIPSAEIKDEKILHELTQEGQVNRQTGKVAMEEPRPGARWATASRQIEGLPVFSSRAVLRFGGKGAIDFLEFHWPMIPQDTILEAHRLDYKIKKGWHPPALEGARVESVEAGIVHSPAIGFVMDFYPAIRVIYAPTEKGLGKKAVKYLDRNGHDIPAPRQFGVLPEAGGAQRPVRKPKKR